MAVGHPSIEGVPPFEEVLIPACFLRRPPTVIARSMAPAALGTWPQGLAPGASGLRALSGRATGYFFSWASRL